MSISMDRRAGPGLRAARAAPHPGYSHLSSPRNRPPRRGESGDVFALPKGPRRLAAGVHAGLWLRNALRLLRPAAMVAAVPNYRRASAPGGWGTTPTLSDYPSCPRTYWLNHSLV